MRSESILVVEDNRLLQMGLQDALEQEGFHVQVADHGRQALALLDSFQADLILSDIAMPEMDGITFFRTVRARPEWVAIPFIFLTARGERRDIQAGKEMGAEDYLVKPVSADDVVHAVRARLARARELRLVMRGQAYEASLTMLANAIEVRDSYTRDHVERVKAYSLALGRPLGFSGRREEELRFGAILHDIGKIHVRDSTLRKETALDEAEWQEMRRHTVNGMEMIKNIPYLAPAVPIVRHHHERWDGRGYPDGLAGEAIPLGARIVAVADAFDAITTDRPYHKARSLEEAYEEIRGASGSRYDPKVIAALEAAWQAGEIRAIYEAA
jgi:putative two-component system response regulator